jgi:hypothetical protein
MLQDPGPELPVMIRRPTSLAGAVESLLAELNSQESAVSPAFRELRELVSQLAEGCPGGRLPERISDRLLCRVPDLLFSGMDGSDKILLDLSFRNAYATWLESQPIADCIEIMRSLWHNLLASCNPVTDGHAKWSAVLARATSEVFPPDLQDAREAVLRYRLFSGGGGKASLGVLQSFRSRVLFGERAEIAPADRDAYAGLELAAEAYAREGLACAIADEFVYFSEESERAVRLIADDPERGFFMLGTLLAPLSGTSSDREGYFRLLAPRVIALFGDPRQSGSCFWVGAY